MNNKNFGFQGNQLSNNYYFGMYNHENLSYDNNRNVLQPSSGFSNQQVEKKPSVEDLVGTFITETRNCFR